MNKWEGQAGNSTLYPSAIIIADIGERFAALAAHFVSERMDTDFAQRGKKPTAEPRCTHTLLGKQEARTDSGSSIRAPSNSCFFR
jgi:hypothetical protein